METIPYPRARLALLEKGLVVVERTTLLEIRGPGAISCVQGIVTHDVVKSGPNRLGFGALLSPKGMIIADLWTVRLGERIWVVADRACRGTVLALLHRQLPPRLARIVDLSDDQGVCWVIGAAAALPPLPSWPAPGEVFQLSDDPAQIAARPGGPAWFSALVLGVTSRLEALAAGWQGAGIPQGTAEDLRAARVVAGFPTLGVEIGEKTLPQEVDFDRLGGVSYTKGCFVGQETVARLHFRGHPNWILRRIRTAGPIDESALAVDGKPIARIGTLLAFEDGSGLGLARVRREIEPTDDSRRFGVVITDLATEAIGLGGNKQGPGSLPGP